ncbi:MAG: RHS repeat protein, partial [Chloroflexi bacterium]|nr:RHS repeat protein [Chloroflexota bacterium]
VNANGRLIHERTAADGFVIEVRKQYDVNGRLNCQLLMVNC